MRYVDMLMEARSALQAASTSLIDDEDAVDEISGKIVIRGFSVALILGEF